MFEMFKNSVTLFLQGRLFQDLGSVIRQVVIGVVIALILAVALAKLGLSLLLAVVLASFIAGVIQPFLFKNLKYA